MTKCSHREGPCLERGACWETCQRVQKPIIIGESPSRTGDRYWQFPMSGQVGKKLCTWAGIEPLPRDRSMTSEYARWYWALRQEFDIMNFFSRYANVDWGHETTHEMMTALIPQLRGRVVVLCGINVEITFAREAVIRQSGFYHWHRQPTLDLDVVVIPHPSGLNRIYNDETARDHTGAVLREAIDRAKSKA